MDSILSFIVSFLLQALAFLAVARFLLQATRADFYNPISQGIVKATDLYLRPLRIIVPSYRNLDLAAFLGAILAFFIMHAALATLGEYPTDITIMLSDSILRVLLLHLFIFKWSILITIIASWLVQGSYHPGLALLSQITEPIMGPARRLLPPLGSIDFSPILVFLILGVIERLLPQFFRTFLG